MKLALRNNHKKTRPNLSRIAGRLSHLRHRHLAESYAEITFVSDRDIAGLAGKFRASPYPTDVLAFAYDEPKFLGEIAISLDTAKRQARERGHALENELLLLCIHGLFHLSGIGDESYRDFCLMKRCEFEAMMKIM